MDDRAAVSKFVCEQNIARYRRMLRTPLTELERDFIERRIAEEQQALGVLTGGGRGGNGFLSKLIGAAFIPDLLDCLTSGFDLVAQAA